MVKSLGQRMNDKPIFIATRGSALALAQANFTLAACRQKFPQTRFEIKIIKTTGDKLQTASLSKIDGSLPKGLFTKELENALLRGEADLAVHSLKDLPTELPAGLHLGGVSGKREDVRDVLIHKFPAQPAARLAGLPPGLTAGTSSTRRTAQLLAMRPDFKVVEIRGNVLTRLHKLAADTKMDVTILAAAGLARLGYRISENGALTGNNAPAGLLARILETDEMLSCVGQGAIGLESREKDGRIGAICRELTDEATLQCVTAERSFLQAIGGGCQAPVGAYARIAGREIHLQVISFLGKETRRAGGCAPLTDAIALGRRVAAELAG
jgi:hydroxymethylbilane synthase